jgi:hypothetical protein
MPPELLVSGSASPLSACSHSSFACFLSSARWVFANCVMIWLFFTLATRALLRCAQDEDDAPEVEAGTGWPDYMRAWDEPRWSTPPSISSTSPMCPPLLSDEPGFVPRIPLAASLVLPVVTVFITSVVLSPLPKSFSKPGSGVRIAVFAVFAGRA